MILVYKIATTGLIQHKLPDDDPAQPHMVHVAARLFDRTGAMVDEMNDLVWPGSWEIPGDSVRFHGIPHGRAVKEGASEHAVLARLLEMDARADVRVGHNEAFDSKVVRLAMLRYPSVVGEMTWEKAKGVCSMKTALDYLAKQDPGTFYGRQAKIEQVYEAVLGDPYPYGKDALDWVTAIQEIYFEVAPQGRGEAA